MQREIRVEREYQAKVVFQSRQGREGWISGLYPLSWTVRVSMEWAGDILFPGVLGCALFSFHPLHITASFPYKWVLIKSRYPDRTGWETHIQVIITKVNGEVESSRVRERERGSAAMFVPDITRTRVLISMEGGRSLSSFLFVSHTSSSVPYLHISKPPTGRAPYPTGHSLHVILASILSFFVHSFLSLL